MQNCIRLNNLKTNKNWVQLSKTWQKLSFIEKQKSHNVNWYEFLDEYKKELDLIPDCLSAMVAEKIISENEKDYIYNLLSSRFNHLLGCVGLITCYMVDVSQDKIVITKNDLEKRYSILQKLYEEGKINTETFNETRFKIIENLKSLDEFAGSKKIEDSVLELIVWLNS